MDLEEAVGREEAGDEAPAEEADHIDGKWLLIVIVFVLIVAWCYGIYGVFRVLKRGVPIAPLQ